MNRTQEWLRRGRNAEILIILTAVVGMFGIVRKGLEATNSIAMFAAVWGAIVILGMSLGTILLIRSQKRKLRSGEWRPGVDDSIKGVRKGYPWIIGLTLLSVVDAVMRTPESAASKTSPLLLVEFRILLAGGAIAVAEAAIWWKGRSGQ